MVDIVEIIDQQMDAPKTITCLEFRDEQYSLVNGDYRASIPVLDAQKNSFTIPLELMIVCPTGGLIDEFNLVLLAIIGDGRKDRKDICRLDFGRNQAHKFNPRFQECPPPDWSWKMFPDYMLKGSHIHSWKLNKHLGSNRGLPKTLPFALPLDAANWEEAFDTFCQETLIQYDARPYCKRVML